MIIDEFETAGRRVAKFADVLVSVWEMEHQYELRVCEVQTCKCLTQISFYTYIFFYFLADGRS